MKTLINLLEHTSYWKVYIIFFIISFIISFPMFYGLGNSSITVALKIVIAMAIYLAGLLTYLIYLYRSPIKS